MVKEGRHKKYRDRVKQYKQNKTFQNNGRKYYLEIGGECARMQRKQNNCGVKYWNRRIIREKWMDK